jgi:hypothetical protein
MIDAWRPHLDNLARVVRTQRLSSCFVLYTEAIDLLRERHPGLPFHWLPVGFNNDVFSDLGRHRDIDVFWMGRRHEPLHQAIQAYCAERQLVYRFSQDVNDPATTEELNELIARSRYFVVTTPDLSGALRTGGFRPLTARYLEGAAAGSSLLGVPPIARELEYFLPPGALVECRADGSDLGTVLDAAEADSGLDGRRIATRDAVREAHGWERRAELLVEHLKALDEPR